MSVESSGLGAAWFIDAGYLFKARQSLQRRDHLDYSKLRQLLEATYLDREVGAVIEDAYFSPPSSTARAPVPFTARSPFLRPRARVSG